MFQEIRVDDTITAGTLSPILVLLAKATHVALTTHNRVLKGQVTVTGMEELENVHCSVLLQVAMRRVHPPEHTIPSSAPPVKQERGGNLLCWFPQLWGWNYMTSAEPDPAPSRTEIELEDQILDVLADSIENNTILRRDVVFGQFNFMLKQGTFHLCTTKATDSEHEAEKYVLCLELVC
jgi:hypothetical protein